MTNPPPSQPPDLSAQILLKLGEISATIAAMNEQLKALPDHEQRIRANEAAIPPNLESRLSALETSKAKLIGAAAGMSALASAGGTWIGVVISHH